MLENTSHLLPVGDTIEEGVDKLEVEYRIHKRPIKDELNDLAQSWSLNL